MLLINIHKTDVLIDTKTINWTETSMLKFFYYEEDTV